MKKYIAPELNVTKFDVEDVITTSVNSTAPVYGEGMDKDNVKEVDFATIFK